MQRQFRLVPSSGSPVCRHGHNACLHHLRLAYRAHRLMEGLMRIGTDALHQSLLEGMAGVQLVPPRFCGALQWAELVLHGLLDGAIVSSFCLENHLLSAQVPKWDGLATLPLGQLALELVAVTPPSPTGVAAPQERHATPLLRQAVGWHGFGVEQQPSACQEPDALIQLARERRLAMPACIGLLGTNWLAANGLVRLAQQPPLIEQLWLLLPQGAVDTKAARQCLRMLRTQISKAPGIEALLPGV